MAEEKTSKMVCAKFPTKPKNGLVTIDEFEELFNLSGDKNRSVFINNAVRHYASVIREQMAREADELIAKTRHISVLFPPKS